MIEYDITPTPPSPLTLLQIMNLDIWFLQYLTLTHNMLKNILHAYKHTCKNTPDTQTKTPLPWDVSVWCVYMCVVVCVHVCGVCVVCVCVCVWYVCMCIYVCVCVWTRGKHSPDLFLFAHIFVVDSLVVVTCYVNC